MTSSRKSRTSALVASTFALLALGVLSSAGCSADGNNAPELVSPDVEVINNTKQALSTGELLWVNGTYSGCYGHADTDTWSALISGPAANMDYSEVSVAMNDSACRLVLKSAVTNEGAGGTAKTYVATNPITIGLSYGTASPFTNTGTLAFYGNAKIATFYAADTLITILFSDDPRADTGATDNSNASYVIETSTASESQVIAPDYTPDLGAVVLTTDFNNVVQSASGSIDMTSYTHSGEMYVVTDNSLGSSFAEIDAAYEAGTPVAFSDVAPISIDAFDLEGQTLDITKALILSHTENGVAAYEVIRITFKAYVAP